MKSRHTALAAAGLCLALTPAFSASGPDWWATYGVLESGQGGDNWSPVNVGQLKNIAAGAKAHLDDTPGVSPGSAINNMVAGFSQNDPENFAPANIGQLITVATVFYDRLESLGYNTTESLIMNGYPPSWAHPYPWDPNTDPAELHAPVNIGQLKVVLSFDLERDSNNDGLSDFERWQNGLTVVEVAPDGESWDYVFDTNGDGLWDAHYVNGGTGGYGLGYDAAKATDGPPLLVLYGPNN
ncbi:MAG: hypothetical protein JJU00_20460 [Opitutales bacterium]|nr:hypothetical protein [Opitutales bacterium]